MSPKPISRSADLTRLRNEGYDLEIRSDHLLVKDVPYVTAGRIVKRGILVMPLKLAGDVTVKPENHVAHFIGEYPCRADGTPIDSIRNDSTRRELGPGVVIDHTFSAKPMPSGAYENYYDKVTQYVTILSGYARVVEPGVTAKTFRPVPAGEGEEETVFKYIDTASTGAEIGSVTAKYSVSGAGACLDPDGARSGSMRKPGLKATWRSGPLYPIAIDSCASPKSGLCAVISSRLLDSLIRTEFDFSEHTSDVRWTHSSRSSRSSLMRWCVSFGI